MPPRDGEGTPPGNEDELLAKVIPLRRRGTGSNEPRILADEPRRAPGPPEDPPELTEWSIWEPLPAKLNWRERKPLTLRVLADEPGGLSDPPDPLTSAEWSIWDRSPPPLRRRKAPDTGRISGAREVGHRVRRRRFIRTVTVAAATTSTAAALALGLVAPERAPGPTSQRATSGLQASRPSATRPAKSTPSRPHRSATARAGSHRRRPGGRTAKTRDTVSKLAAVGAGGGVSATVQYRPPTDPSPTTASASPPPAGSAPAPTEGSATASASREFSFER